MPMLIQIYTDPGHGWGVAKRALLVELGIAHRVSSYSYQSHTGSTAARVRAHRRHLTSPRCPCLGASQCGQSHNPGAPHGAIGDRT